MKEKKINLKDLFDEYIELIEEQIETLLLMEKAQKKVDKYLSQDKEFIYKSDDAEDLFKLYNSIKKYNQRKKEIAEELKELENSLKEFFTLLQGGKVSYERKEDPEKLKNTYLFCIEEET